jgi:chaperonin GroES
VASFLSFSTTLFLRRKVLLFEHFDISSFLPYNGISNTIFIRRNVMKLKPMNDWAVIRPSDAAEKTPGGIYIPDSAKEKPQEGVVEAIGPGAFEEEKFGKKKDQKKKRKFVPSTVKPGDRVLYERYAGQTYAVEGEDVVLVRERDILGILSGDGHTPPQIAASTSAKGSTALVKKVPGQVQKVKKPTSRKPAKKK